MQAAACAKGLSIRRCSISQASLHCSSVLPVQVAAAVKGLSMADILAYEKSGSIELAGHTLGEGDIKVKHSFSTCCYLLSCSHLCYLVSTLNVASQVCIACQSTFWFSSSKWLAAA
jgi:hypothetical protein